MFLTKEDLQSHLRNELQDLITRGDDTIIAAAIDGAVAEAKGYLGRFDTERIFRAEGAERNDLLLIFIKDIATYHLINLTSPGIHYDRREKRYDRAVEWLKAVQRGDVSPDLPKTEDAETQGGLVYYLSNPKRAQHF